ncbi:hypothetical protein ACKKBG_A10180 [Auxenochlorella protothecoides x Auxenochlorella symbiontica]
MHLSGIKGSGLPCHREQQDKWLAANALAVKGRWEAPSQALASIGLVGFAYQAPRKSPLRDGQQDESCTAWTILQPAKSVDCFANCCFSADGVQSVTLNALCEREGAGHLHSSAHMQYAPPAPSLLTIEAAGKFGPARNSLALVHSCTLDCNRRQCTAQQASCTVSLPAEAKARVTVRREEDAQSLGPLQLSFWSQSAEACRGPHLGDERRSVGAPSLGQAAVPMTTSELRQPPPGSDSPLLDSSASARVSTSPMPRPGIRGELRLGPDLRGCRSGSVSWGRGWGRRSLTLLNLGSRQGRPWVAVDAVSGKTRLSLSLRRGAPTAAAPSPGQLPVSVSLQSAWSRVLGLSRVKARVACSAGGVSPSLSAWVQSSTLRLGASWSGAGTWKAQAEVALGTLAWH